MKLPLSIRALLQMTLFCWGALVSPASGADRVFADLEKRFLNTVQPLITTYCLECHSQEKPKGNFDLSPYTQVSTVLRDQQQWESVLERLQAGEMPPKKIAHRPTSTQSLVITSWLRDLWQYEAAKNANDPGLILARRLSNTEYDRTLRDLIGVDLRPTRQFPVDPANQAGFDNTGESLTLSPALLRKYLEAAREVSQHAVLTLDGIAFATHPMMVHTDRDKYGTLRIVEFYQRQPTDYADYFAAAWRYKQRVGLGKSHAQLSDIARESQVSLKYLSLIWDSLKTAETVGPMARLQVMWHQLPGPTNREMPSEVRLGCEAMREFVLTLREAIRPTVANLEGPEMNPSAQALVLWKNRQWAANRRIYATNTLQIEGTVPKNLENDLKPETGNRKKRKTSKPPMDPRLIVPSDARLRSQYEAAFTRFAALFPDAFYVKERGRSFMDPEEEKANGNVGRLLSAGLHNQTGYFRDDGPLYDLILDKTAQSQLDRLWDEFNMIASVPQRMHQSTVYFERTDSRFLSDAEFDFARAEDKDCTTEAKVKKLAERYYAKAVRVGANSSTLAAIREHFQRVPLEIGRIEKLERDSEPKHLEALIQFAQKAFRRSLDSTERAELLDFYQTLRVQDGLTHDEAIRDSIARVLVSPKFCYRIDLVEASVKEKFAKSTSLPQFAAIDRGQALGIIPLSDDALASRLSYFLWSTAPDDALLARAAAGDLHRPEVMAEQARRMLKDQRIRGMVTEFAGQWLDFRRFEEHNAVDRTRFPLFTDALREAMFEEPIRFMMDSLQKNRSVLDFLYANHTFVNPVLAQHYGLPHPSSHSNDWVRVENLGKVGRGSLLSMSVFLTANSPGLRTSPVKRGYWVARRLLGERIPPPPPTVPELPADESKLGERTLRETLAIHRADANCASCHQRFDSLGLVFEGFGPVGERRTLDLGGRPIDTHAVFPDGSEGNGLAGLRLYLKKRRENDFLNTLCRKFLAYGLGRSLILSDEVLVKKMRSKLSMNGHQFGNLVETIITSSQFLNKRGPIIVAAQD